jgi:hypothetical protein
MHVTLAMCTWPRGPLRLRLAEAKWPPLVGLGGGLVHQEVADQPGKARPPMSSASAIRLRYPPPLSASAIRLCCKKSIKKFKIFKKSIARANNCKKIVLN